jgi:hypothetical protein
VSASEDSKDWFVATPAVMCVNDSIVRWAVDGRKNIDVSILAEFCCWAMVLLAPFLYWVNGPVVSTDQLVVRSVLVGTLRGHRFAYFQNPAPQTEVVALLFATAAARRATDGEPPYWVPQRLDGKDLACSSRGKPRGNTAT